MSAPAERPGWTDIVFDGPPALECGRFIDVENEERASFRLGDWMRRDDGYWVLRIPASGPLIAAAPALAEENEALRKALEGLLGVSESGNPGLLDNRLWDAARAALAAAKGGKP